MYNNEIQIQAHTYTHTHTLTQVHVFSCTYLDPSHSTQDQHRSIQYPKSSLHLNGEVHMSYVKNKASQDKLWPTLLYSIIMYTT